MYLLNTIESLLDIKGIPQQDKEILLEMQKKIQDTNEYSEDEYHKVMDLFCKYSLC